MPQKQKSLSSYCWLVYNNSSSCTIAHNYQLAASAMLPRCCSSWACKSIPVDFLYLHIYGPKNVNFFTEKYHSCFLNVLPKTNFMENIEMQSEPRFTGYSMSTLNIYRHRPCRCPLRNRTEFVKFSNRDLINTDYSFCLHILLAIDLQCCLFLLKGFC